jgi:Rrf2 family transcriptional regulator, iron-sulfur cluster assembly transcription factor
MRAMTYMARFPLGHVVSLRDIGRAQEIPESFLAKILQSLVHADLAVSQRGARGGFALARSAAQITMRDVVEAVDGPVSINVCVLSPEDCTRNGECQVHKAWVHAQLKLMEVLDSVTLESLAPTRTH